MEDAIFRLIRCQKKSLIDKNLSHRKGHRGIFLDTDFTDYTANWARGREKMGLKNCAAVNKYRHFGLTSQRETI